jgi:hypothetical protein
MLAVLLAVLVPLSVFVGIMYFALAMVQPWLLALDAPAWIAGIVSIVGGLWVGGWAAMFTFIIIGSLAGNKDFD